MSFLFLFWFYSFLGRLNNPPCFSLTLHMRIKGAMVGEKAGESSRGELNIMPTSRDLGHIVFSFLVSKYPMLLSLLLFVICNL